MTSSQTKRLPPKRTRLPLHPARLSRSSRRALHGGTGSDKSDAMETRAAVLGVERSLTGKAWRWRGGNMELPDGAAGLEDDVVTQLLLARGVARADLARHRSPTLRD